MTALKKAAVRPSVRPANEATAMKAALKEAVEVKKTVKSSNIDLSKDRRVPSKRSVVIKHRDFRDILNSGGEPGCYLEGEARDQGRDVGDREQGAHHERDQEGHGCD